MSDILKQLILGIQTGSMYALVALGYTMVYGIIRLINFAHGDFIMVACFMIYTFWCMIGLPVILGIIIAVLIAILLGFLTEKIAYRPLRKNNSPSITALITAIAISLFLQNLFQKIYGSEQIMVGEIIKEKQLTLGSISFDNISVITIGIAVVAMLLLSLFITKTKTGKAMRAVSENADAAKLMGINIDKTISITFIIGTFLAGIASLMYIMKYQAIAPMIGSNLGLYAFIAAVVGGIGSIPGACVGGFVIGIMKILPTLLNIDSAFSDIFLFGTLILILIFKPAGLFGKNVREKV